MNSIAKLCVGAFVALASAWGCLGEILPAVIGAEGENLTVFVPAGAATGKRVCLVWGETDKEDAFTQWEHTRTLAESVDAQSLTATVPLEELALAQGQKMRVLALDELALLDRIQMNNS